MVVIFLDGAPPKISEIVSRVIEDAYAVISYWSHDWQITPAKCRYEVMSTKIEIRLAKAELLHWTSLEYTTEPVVVQRPIVSSGKPACSSNMSFWLSGGSSPPFTRLSIQLLLHIYLNGVAYNDQ